MIVKVTNVKDETAIAEFVADARPEVGLKLEVAVSRTHEDTVAIMVQPFVLDSENTWVADMDETTLEFTRTEILGGEDNL